MLGLASSTQPTERTYERGRAKSDRPAIVMILLGFPAAVDEFGHCWGALNLRLPRFD